MIKCENCGYFYADVDENGVPKDYARCHYVGPDAWSPCAQDDDYYEEGDN